MDLLPSFLAGVVDIIVNYPPYGLKYRAQIGEKITLKSFSLRKLYQGSVPCAVSCIPSLMIQDSASRSINEMSRSLGIASAYSQALSAFSGGFISAFFAAPVGNIIVTQQKYSYSPFAAMKFIYQRGGISHFAIGLKPLMIRDAFYSGSVFWGVKAVRDQCINWDLPAYVQADVFASVIVGGIGSIISHPVDTLATHLQSEVKKDFTAWKQTKEFIQKQGVKGLYAGAGWRFFSISSSICCTSKVMEVVADMMKPQKS